MPPEELSQRNMIIAVTIAAVIGLFCLATAFVTGGA